MPTLVDLLICPRTRYSTPVRRSAWNDDSKRGETVQGLASPLNDLGFDHGSAMRHKLSVDEKAASVLYLVEDNSDDSI